MRLNSDFSVRLKLDPAVYSEAHLLARLAYPFATNYTIVNIRKLKLAQIPTSIVFLDFDGVINASGGDVTPAHIARLNTVTDSTGAGIAVHSSWRWSRTLDEIQNILRNWGVTAPFIDVCPAPKLVHGIIQYFVDWDEYVAGVPSSDERCIAVQRWLWKHPETKAYVILDDSSKLGYFVDTPQFLKCDTDIGITDTHVARAIELLNAG